jgi:hypothetical protein
MSQQLKDVPIGGKCKIEGLEGWWRVTAVAYQRMEIEPISGGESQWCADDTYITEQK